MVTRSGTPPERALKRIIRLAVICALVLYAWHGWSALGNVPLHADTIGGRTSDKHLPGYVAMARDDSFDERRSVLYPRFVRAFHDTGSQDWFAGLDMGRPRGEGPVRAWHLRLQLTQWFVFVGALLYACHALTGRRLARSDLLPIGLVALDPLALHVQMSVLPDGLTLSACLVFVAGWIQFVARGRRSGAVAAAIAALLLPLLRPEKGFVLIAVALAAPVAHLLLARVRRSEQLAPPLRRYAVVLGSVLIAFVAVGVTKRALIEPSPAHMWSTGEIVVHSRLVHPHLHTLRSSLSPETQERIPEYLVPFYDSSTIEARRVIDLVTASDPDLRAELTREMGRTALREVGHLVLLDCVVDTLKNLLPIVPATIEARQWYASAPDERSLKADSATAWRVMAYDTRPSVKWAVGALAGVIVLGAFCAARGARRADRHGPATVPILLIASFALVNGAAFAFTQDLLVMRYVVFSHVVLVGALAAAVTTHGRSRPPAPAAPARTAPVAP